MKNSKNFIKNLAFLMAVLLGLMNFNLLATVHSSGVDDSILKTNPSTLSCQPDREKGLFRDQQASTLLASDPKRLALTDENYGKLPLSFEPNCGQADSRIKFMSRASDCALFLTSDEAVVALRNPAGAYKGHKGELRAHKTLEKPGSNIGVTAVRMRMVGAAAGALIEGLDELPGKSNYFIGKDMGRWTTSVPNFAGVQYRGLYPGVNLIFYGTQRQLEYDFVVAPGADPNLIKLAFKRSPKDLGGRKWCFGVAHSGRRHSYAQAICLSRDRWGKAGPRGSLRAQG